MSPYVILRFWIDPSTILHTMLWAQNYTGRYYGVTHLFTFVMLNILCTTLLPNFYPFNLQHFTCKHLFSIRLENSVDPDQLASSEVFSKRINTGQQDKC